MLSLWEIVKMPLKLLPRRRNTYRLPLKVKKSHKFITTVKHVVQREIFLLFLSRYTKHAYDFLSK